MSLPSFRLFSWNVNGLRAAEKKGFWDWMGAEDPDFVGIQEVRALPEQLSQLARAPEGRVAHFVSATRKGYSGVGMLSRNPVTPSAYSLGDARFDDEGRLQAVEIGQLLVVNGYFPNGNGKDRDNSRVPYKLEFYERLRKSLEPQLAQGRPVLVMGDFNTAHTAIDLARPQQNLKTSGFLPEEREGLELWMQAGWTDTFRHREKGEGHYTWWSQRAGVRAKNIGWRIDMILASPAALPFVREAQIHPMVLGSDHCPISVSLDPAVFQLQS